MDILRALLDYAILQISILWKKVKSLDKDIASVLSAAKSIVKLLGTALRTYINSQTLLIWNRIGLIEKNLPTNIVKWVNKNVIPLISDLDINLSKKINAIDIKYANLINKGFSNFNAFLTNLEKRINKIQKDINTRINIVKSDIEETNNNFLSLLKAFTKLKGSLAFNTPDELMRILLGFASKPLETMAAFLIPHLLMIIENLIADELGTTNRKLAPNPIWEILTSGTLNTVIGPLPEHNNQLVNPLDDIFITGYTFTPSHLGIDLGLKNGTPVYSMHNGRVTRIVHSDVGYGIHVDIQNDLYHTRYAHLLETQVSLNQIVKAGDVIALGDNTGNSTGPHLHLEIKLNGVYIDPIKVIKV